MEENINVDGSQVSSGAPDADAAAAVQTVPGWTAQLPDSLKGNAAFTEYKTIGELAKAHLDNSGKVTELEGKVANSIPKLTETSTDEEKAAYFTALGVPDSPDKYEFVRPTMPEGIPYNEPLEQMFRASAHKAGISQSAAQVLYGDYMNFGNAFIQQQMEERQATLAEGMKTLEKEWGNKFAANVKVAQEVQKAIGLADPEMKKILSDHNLGNDPAIVKWLINLAPAYLGDNAPMGSPAGSKPDEGLFYPSMKNLGG
jgi:hypothetical protein